MDNVYVGEVGNSHVSVFTSSGDFLYSFREGVSPVGLAVHEDGHLYVCNRENSIVIY